MSKISEVFYENKYHIFVEYCRLNEKNNMTDLDGFDFNELKSVKGIGVSKIESIRKRYLKYSDNAGETDEFSLIHPENLSLSVWTFSLFDISKNMISHLLDDDISTLLDVAELGRDGLYKLNSSLCTKITGVLKNYNEPLIKKLPYFLNRVKEDEHFEIVLIRSEGETLNKIGTELNITRERVRQLDAVMLKRLKSVLDIVLDDIVRKYMYKSCINLNKLELYFKDYDDLNLMKYTLSSVYKNTYLEFCNKLLINGDTREKVLDKLGGITEYYIKDIVNYNAKMVIITESLLKNNIPYIDIEDLTNYLLLNGYIKKGNYIYKSGISYGVISTLIVKKYFKDGIRIHEEAEIERLRHLIKKEFGDIDLPENNRALGSRIASFLVLCDRGCYTVPSNLKISGELLHKIRNYIDEYKGSTLFFNDIFVHFKNELLLKSNVYNRYYLQGVLKFFYEDEFEFERDSVTKPGQERKSMRSLIAEFLKNSHGPVHKRDIKAKFPGATDVVITNAQISDRNILQWAYNYYIHADNLDVSEKDKKDILDCIEELFKRFKGYAGEQLLYDMLVKRNKSLLIKNHIKSPSNLFYLTAYLYKNKYMFRRPHILKDASTRKDLSSRIIIEKFLFDDGVLRYTDYQKFVSTMKWSIGTAYAVFKDVEKDIVRISEDEYIVKEKFNISEEALYEIFSCISSLVEKKQFLSVNRFDKWNELPDIGFSWNVFLLSSIVTGYLPDTLKIIVPTVEDRRYVKEIIVEKENNINSYEELIISIVKENNLNGATVYRLESMLSSMGIIGRYLPKELYNSKNIYIENDRLYTI